MAVPGGIVGSVKELRRLAFFRSNPKGLLAVWKMLPRHLWNKIAARRHISSGRALVARLRYTLQEAGVPLWLKTGLDELRLEGGTVIGARVTREGKPLMIQARRGVMIAAGAALDLMDDMWWMPSSVEPGAAAPTIHVFERGLPHFLIVDARGKRFANEARPYNELGRVIFENSAPPTFMVFDQEYRNRYAMGTMLPGITPERFIKGGLLTN